MDIPRVLERMGIVGQDMGSLYDTYEHFSNGNRFTEDTPTEASMVLVWEEIQNEDAINAPLIAREEEYNQIMSGNSFMEAYFEREYESKPDKMDALQVEREKVKVKYPKI